VFFDSDSIIPGEKWRDALQNAISTSDQMIIIWCCHSAKSKEVAAEIEFGLGLNKPIIPVLCCDFPVEEKLRKFQWIDVRKFVNHRLCDHDGDHDSYGEDVVMESTSEMNRSDEYFEDPFPEMATNPRKAKILRRIKRVVVLVLPLALIFFLFKIFFPGNFKNELNILGNYTIYIILGVIILVIALLFVRFVRAFEKSKWRRYGDFASGDEIIISEDYSEPKDELEVAKIILSAIEETHSDPARYYPKKD